MSCCNHEECGAEENIIYQEIDTSKINGYNEKVSNQCREIFKPYCERMDMEKYTESCEDDPELIINIPFSEAVILRSICLVGGDGGTAPSQISLFADKDNIDFSNVESLTPTQEITLGEDFTGELWYPLKHTKFHNIQQLTIFIPSNFGGDNTKLYYIGLKGKGTKIKRGIVECVYEARANPAKHKLYTKNTNKFQFEF